MDPTHQAHDSALLEQLLTRRHSCRRFLPEPVPRPTIERMLELAQRSASWCNAQPWQVIVTNGEATESFRRLLLDNASASASPDFPWPRAYQGIYQQRRRECGLALYHSVGIANGDREASAQQGKENFRLFGAPHVAIITTDEALGVYGAVDCGAYVANFLLAATSLGVATIAQAALAARGPLVRAHFGLPDDRRLVCGISFGFADAEHPANRFRTSRAPLADAMQWVE